ncbi:MAG TPA: S53 family peptidase [Candidatus Baltobacteraceae bacterium]|nr:S53 family peptidase [Candidatus Baltobacteraceae bacterium]
MNAPKALTAQATQAARGDVVATPADLQQLGVSDAGRAPATTTLSLAVALRYRNQDALDRLVAQQSNPESASYRRWLSNAQFDARFAPTKAGYRTVLASLRRAGFRIDRTYENRTVIDATAGVATIERYFRTSIHRVRSSKGGVEYANVRSAFAPPALSALVLGVDGLNTVAVVHPYYALIGRGRRRSIPAEPQAPTLFGPVSSVTGARGYAPVAFSAGYDLPVMHATGTGKYYDGSGRASGIVIDADFAESDLRQFLAHFKIARTGPATRRVLLHGGPPPGDGASDSVEAALDAEALVGDAPGTALSVYEIPNLKNASITDAYNTAVSQNVVDAVNSSFGGCEAAIGTKTVGTWSALAEQGASKGITFHASSGDSGGSLCASAPASSPYVVAVGGTALTVGVGGAWAAESAWSGSGGGISSLFARPSWQATTLGTIDRGRNVPDVALDADPYTGIALYYTGTWNTQYDPLGGTSLSSPLFGAAVAELDQVKNGRLGLATGGLYAAFAAHGYAAGPTAYFHDVVQGGNGAFYAGTGYDLVTGIGSLDVWNLTSIL